MSFEPRIPPSAACQLVHHMWGHGRVDSDVAPFVAISPSSSSEDFLASLAKLGEDHWSVIAPREGIRAAAVVFPMKGLPSIGIFGIDGTTLRHKHIDMPSVPPVGEVEKVAFEIDRTSLDLVHGTMLVGWWCERQATFHALDLITHYGVVIESIGGEDRPMFSARRKAVNNVCKWMTSKMDGKVRATPAIARRMIPPDPSEIRARRACLEGMEQELKEAESGIDSVVFVAEASQPCSVSTEQYRAVELPTRFRIRLLFYCGTWCVGSVASPQAVDVAMWTVRSFVEEPEECGVYVAEPVLDKGSVVFHVVAKEEGEAVLASEPDLRAASVWRLKLGDVVGVDRWVRMAEALSVAKATI